MKHFISCLTFVFLLWANEIYSQTTAVTEGKKVYMKHCFACHQIDGSGVPGMYPPLKKTDWVSGDKTRLIKLTLDGLKENILVNGEEFNLSMPPHKFLTDKQTADVLTYIRQSFGNKAGPVTPAEVAKIRKNLKN